jgi:hypothetical protein
MVSGRLPRYNRSLVASFSIVRTVSIEQHWLLRGCVVKTSPIPLKTRSLHEMSFIKFSGLLAVRNSNHPWSSGFSLVRGPWEHTSRKWVRNFSVLLLSDLLLYASECTWSLDSGLSTIFLVQRVFMEKSGYMEKEAHWLIISIQNRPILVVLNIFVDI